MANASIFASSHKLQISQLDVGQQIQSALEKSLNYSNLGIGLKVSNCNSFISAAYCKLAFRQAQEGATKPSSTKFSNSSCSQGDIITVKCQLFMSIPTAINASIASRALSPQENILMKFSTLLHDGLPNQPTHQPCQKLPSTLHLNSQTTHVPTR
jgi:hypothetical protein